MTWRYRPSSLCPLEDVIPFLWQVWVMPLLGAAVGNLPCGNPDGLTSGWMVAAELSSPKRAKPHTITRVSYAEIFPVGSFLGSISAELCAVPGLVAFCPVNCLIFSLD